MKTTNLKKLMMCVALATMSLSAQAQFLKSSYFVDGATTRLKMNPALQPMRGYTNVPILGSFSVAANSNTLGVTDIIDVVDDGDDIFSNNTLYDRLKTNNNLNINLNTDIISMGWFSGKNFWSINAGLRLDMGARINKGMFDFMRNVNGYSLESIAGQNASYNMGNQKIRMSAYGEVGLGFSRRITEKLTVGVRGKALLGLARAEMNIERFDVDMDIPEIPANGAELSPSDWMGKGYNYTAKGNVMTTMKGGGIAFDQDGMIEDFDFEADDLGLAGWGLGIDFGASYEFNKHLTVSAAVLDLGFLKWDKGKTRMGTVDQSENTTINDDNYYEVIDGDFLSLERFNFKEQQNVDYKSKTSLSSTVILAAEYAILNKKVSFGAMYSAHMVEPKTLHDVTLSATYRPKNWFNVSASYSPILSDGKSMGIVLKLGPVLLGTDYMYFGNNSKSVNAFLGMSFPLGSKRKEYSQL